MIGVEQSNYALHAEMCHKKIMNELNWWVRVCEEQAKNHPCLVRQAVAAAQASLLRKYRDNFEKDEGLLSHFGANQRKYWNDKA